MDQSSEVTDIVDNLVGPMRADICERMDVICLPTMSGNSHLSKRVFLGVSMLERNRKRNESRVFLNDFGFVPGSQSNQ